METTALLCPVPRVAPLLTPWRDRHDPSAAAGVPPHLTVVAPFLPPDRITRADVDALRDLMEDRQPIDAELAEVGMFDNDVLHLRPDPDEPFRALVEAVAARFPDAPPYGGRHPDIVPHVTVGKAIPRASARHAARSLMLALPVRIRVDVVQLWVRGDDGWRAAVSFPLGPPVRRAA